MNPLKIMKMKWFPPAERKESFAGQVVLVTGANTGLGLEAAKKIAALKADKLIITTRSIAKGESTKKNITEWLASNGSSQATEIVPLILDMGSSDGVKAFVNQLTATTNRLHSAILNAGVNQPEYRTTSEGFEETIAVNTVNTTFLSILLLPLLRSTAQASGASTHLSIISSRNATMPQSMTSDSKIISSPTPLKDFSEAQNFPHGAMGGFFQYGRSKLLLEYSIRRMIHLPFLHDKDGKSLVIVNSVCPGMTKTDLGRSYQSWWHKLLTIIIFTLFAKSAADGANSYLTALSLDQESSGQMWADDMYLPEWPNLSTPNGKKLGDNVWSEMRKYMKGWDSSVSSIVDEK